VEGVADSAGFDSHMFLLSFPQKRESILINY